MRHQNTLSDLHASWWTRVLSIALSLVLVAGTTPLAFAEEAAEALPEATEVTAVSPTDEDLAITPEEPALDPVDPEQCETPSAEPAEELEEPAEQAADLPELDLPTTEAEAPAEAATPIEPEADEPTPLLADADPVPDLEDISSYTAVLPTNLFWYTGQPICPRPIVYEWYYDYGDGWTDEGPTLNPSCYTVTYSNNVAAGTATITITGTGNCTGTIRKSFAIRCNIAQATAPAIKAKTYSGKAFTPSPAITFAGKRLVKGTDYTISYKSNKKAGTAKVIISGKGNYAGSKTLTFKIKKKSIKKAKVAKISDKRCTGKSIKPKPKVKVGKTKLKKGRDYTLSYKRNKNAGTATIIIKGKGNYSGKKKVTFKITGTAPRSGSAGSSSSGQSQTVYGTRTGECYHRDWCSSLRYSRIPMSRGEAESRGLRPCKVCRP